jgi:hypothetical protein
VVGQSECGDLFSSMSILQLFHPLHTRTMRHSKTLLTPAEALLRVYAPVYAPTCRHTVMGRRTFSQAAVTSANKKRGLPAGFKLPSLFPRTVRSEADDRLADFKIDDRIETFWVQVRQERPDGNTLDRPTRLETLLDQISPDECVLELSSTGPNPDTAVVAVVKREELLRRAPEKAKQLKEFQRQQKVSRRKQLEVNWAIGQNDLELKLKQLEAFLDQGRVVEILLAAKKRQRRATLEEANVVVDKLRAKIGELNAREVKDMEGKLLGLAMMTVQKT